MGKESKGNTPYPSSLTPKGKVAPPYPEGESCLPFGVRGRGGNFPLRGEGGKGERIIIIIQRGRGVAAYLGWGKLPPLPLYNGILGGEGRDYYSFPFTPVLPSPTPYPKGEATFPFGVRGKGCCLPLRQLGGVRQLSPYPPSCLRGKRQLSPSGWGRRRGYCYNPSDYWWGERIKMLIFDLNHYF